jgi:pyridoxine 5'-phosphate synthase PdxJ
MPRYYFHVKHGQMTVLDHEGTELVNLEEAANEAVRRGQKIVAGHARTYSGRIIIADDNWQTVYELTFKHTDF